ncbi:lipoate-protein ligase A [Tetragenococcus muriaticus PMC-11-5]|uniref:lipoate--protein ligase n=1 Tax=Tetragenococcus muriaticus PMC-11-5 TaxID=1302649 RepID=A0A091C7U5_9ENTE|nr:lipoate-protein ligase A [Tetragenococcus muriaticus PMC-11-5]
MIDDMKFSGNAMYSTNGRMYAHGTLMLDSDKNEVTNALKVRKDKIESKGVKSIRSRVTNIKPFLPKENQDMTTEEFKEEILLKIFGVDSVDEVNTYELTDEDWQKIQEYTDKYYGNWDWNYGHSPEFNVERYKRFSIGSIDIRLNVQEGKIANAKIYGDFFGLGDIKDVEDKLIGTRYEKEALKKVVDTIDVKKYFGDMENKELFDLIY